MLHLTRSTPAVFGGQRGDLNVEKLFAYDVILCCHTHLIADQDPTSVPIVVAEVLTARISSQIGRELSRCRTVWVKLDADADRLVEIRPDGLKRNGVSLKRAKAFFGWHGVLRSIHEFMTQVAKDG
jgi:hypothetical protein